ncbi:hypothetical protein RCL1_006484 [Eukaryota sp. TZLM3-RCL]
MLSIDGSHGEGGGQVLRTTLSIATAIGQSVRIFNIRAGRDKPGLRPQHLTAVNACTTISNAKVKGNSVGSTEITFIPNRVGSGDYTFDIGTAGSVNLLLQTLIPPLLTASGRSKVTVIGGTQNPFSPNSHYLVEVFVPLLRKLGANITVRHTKEGFYPQGGGRMELEVDGFGTAHPLSPLTLLQRGSLLSCSVLSAVARLPEHVNDGLVSVLNNYVKTLVPANKIERRRENWDTKSPGCVASIRLDYEHTITAAFAIGKRGVSAEEIAQEAVDDLDKFVLCGDSFAVDRHLCDMLITILAFSMGKSRFTTTEITLHSLTNAEVVNIFYPNTVKITGSEGSPGTVEINM